MPTAVSAAAAAPAAPDNLARLRARLRAPTQLQRCASQRRPDITIAANGFRRPRWMIARAMALTTSKLSLIHI
eukprot:2553939-Pyramimonas_sp.AAC.1